MIWMCLNIGFFTPNWQCQREIHGDETTNFPKTCKGQKFWMILVIMMITKATKQHNVDLFEIRPGYGSTSPKFGWDRWAKIERNYQWDGVSFWCPILWKCRKKPIRVRVKVWVSWAASIWPLKTSPISSQRVFLPDGYVQRRFEGFVDPIWSICVPLSPEWIACKTE